MSETSTSALPLPTTKQWLFFLNRLLLLTGLLFFTAAVTFFIAANWGDFGRFSKLFGLQLLLCLQVAGFIVFHKSREKFANILLASAALLLGVLLAFVGQTYQTGADPWQLFALWALLIIPWACIVNHWGLWLWCVLLVDIAIVLYHQSLGAWMYSVFASQSLLWSLLLWQGACLLLCQLMIYRYGFALQRLLTFLGFGFCSVLMLLAVFGIVQDTWSVVLLSLFLASIYSYLYRYLLLNIGMLASAAMFYLVASTTIISQFILTQFFVGGLLLLAGFVVGSSIVMVNYLRGLQKVLDNEQ